MPLPIAREVNRLAALHRQRRYAVHLIAIRPIARPLAPRFNGARPLSPAAAGCVPANVDEYFIATPGESVSAIQISSGGTLHVTEIV